MNLFISYRRDDSEGFAGWLAELLRSSSEAGEADEVFLDVDDIAPGKNFVTDMIAAVEQADAVLVIIGRRWVRPSLQQNDDAVRLEIEEAITKQRPIYCVIVDDASAPPGASRSFTPIPASGPTGHPSPWCSTGSLSAP